MQHNMRCFPGIRPGTFVIPNLCNELRNPSKLLTFILFADDTNIYFESEDLTKLTKTVNKELKKVKNWMDCNRLALNIEKNFVLFHAPKKKLSVLIPLKFDKKI